MYLSIQLPLSDSGRDSWREREKGRGGERERGREGERKRERERERITEAHCVDAKAIHSDRGG